MTVADKNTSNLTFEAKGVRIAVGWPGNEMTNAFVMHSEIIYYTEQGWIIKDEQDVSSFAAKCKDNVSATQIDPFEIQQKIQKWYPVIYRWSNLGVSIEHQISKTVISVSKLIHEIKALNIKTFVFHTGVPHHYDSMSLSIACELAGVRQIFLYANVFDGALIPLSQEGSLIKREVLLWKGGGKTYSKVIDEYVSRRLNNKTPSTSDPQDFYSNWWKISIGIAFGYLLYGFVRKGLASLRRMMNEKQNNDQLKLKDYSFFDHVKIMLAQREFVKNYYKKCVNYESIDFVGAASNPVKLLIAAHYQPEATSFPEGWDYYTHIDVVLKIRSLGYVDKLYYKEHYGIKFYLERYVGLTRVGLCRNMEYLKSLVDLGCTLISPELPLPMRVGFVPVTITGTIAIERALLGLRTIVLGRPWYLGLPGVVHINEIETLREVPKAWAMPDAQIAKQAKNFILNCLDSNTLTNTEGIGVGQSIDDVRSNEDYKRECVSLLGFIQ